MHGKRWPIPGGLTSLPFSRSLLFVGHIRLIRQRVPTLYPEDNAVKSECKSAKDSFAIQMRSRRISSMGISIPQPSLMHPLRFPIPTHTHTAESGT
ncbi:hypothetical protein TNIN_46221 [Trichonephila inaurata madagascariensis]|uniref:Uncharacterized protein n=1 Tax=Trichonephila inaurata madagascariensis TaxID=2747483 RepID=A0A8X6YTK6_9ARAC|nr:hypothetical protein TNIN_46221 [Trichonephila inaurata madagascariensis]